MRKGLKILLCFAIIFVVMRLFTLIIKGNDDSSTSATQETRFSGVEVYNESDIRICLAPAENPTAHHPLVIYIENNSECDVSVGFNDVYFDDELVLDFITGTTVDAHSTYEDEVFWFYPEDHNFNDISTISCKVSVLPHRLDGSVSSADLAYSEAFTFQIR